MLILTLRAAKHSAWSACKKGFRTMFAKFNWVFAVCHSKCHHHTVILYVPHGFHSTLYHIRDNTGDNQLADEVFSLNKKQKSTYLYKRQWILVFTSSILFFWSFFTSSIDIFPTHKSCHMQCPFHPLK